MKNLLKKHIFGVRFLFTLSISMSFSLASTAAPDVIFSSVKATPQTNYNGSVVVATYAGSWTPSDYDVKLTVGGTPILATVGGSSTLNFVIPGSVALASNVYACTITATEKADPTQSHDIGFVNLYQGARVDGTPSGWFSTSAPGNVLAQEGGAWSSPVPGVADEKLVIRDNDAGEYSDYVFVPTNAVGQAVVVNMAVSFDAPLDEDPNDVSSANAALRLVTVGDDDYRFAAFVNGVWATNNNYVAEIGTSYVLRVTVNYREVPATVTYEVGTNGYFETVENGPVSAVSSKLGSVTFNGTGKLAQLAGSITADTVDASLVEDGEHTKYANVDQAFASGKSDLKLLWDASWDPSVMRAGPWTIAANNHKLYTSTEGVKLDFDGTTYTVVGDYFEAMTFWISDDTVHTNMYTYLTNALVKSPSSATNLMLRSVALPSGSGNEFALDKSVVLVGDTNELTGAGFAVANGETLTIASGYIGVEALGGEGMVSLEGGKYTVAGTNKWEECLAADHHFAGLAIPEGDYACQVIVGAQAKTGEILLPVSEDGKTTAGSLALTKQQLTDAKVIDGDETTDEIVAKLNATADNHNKVWENVVLGLKNNDEMSIPVVTPLQSTNPNAVTLKPTGITVDKASGATVTYRVHMADMPGGKSANPVIAGSYENEVEMPLPTTGVKYYTIEVVTTPAR